LAAKDVLLILCGAKSGGVLESALRAVDLWPGVGDEGRLEVFVGLNEALEWTENAYLYVSCLERRVPLTSSTAFYENQQFVESPAVKTIDFPKVAKPPFTLAESFANSPRRSHLAKAGGDTLPTAYQPASPPSPTSDVDHYAQPLPLLLQTLGPYLASIMSTSTLSLPSLSDESWDFLSDLAPYFTRIAISSNTVLWRQSDPADGLYLIELGSLRATYSYDNHTREVQETMVAGTIAGDLSTLSNTTRNATTVAERDCVLWKMDLEALERLEKEHPATASRFTRIVLKGKSSHLILFVD
jgi:SulP family sulfate permease